MHLAILLLLKIILSSSSVAANLQNDNETLPTPHIIIVGPTGAGKSSLACSLIGGNPASDHCLFPVCNEGMDSCTKNTTYCGNSTWLGFSSNPMFTVVDTPGFQDSDEQMPELLEEMINVLNEEIKTADVVLLTIPEDTVRFNQGLIDMLKQLEMLFGRKMWNSTMIEISKFSYDQDEIDDRKEDCDDPDELCKDEAYFYKEINDQLQENFHIGMNLSIVFIDSYARKEKNWDDELQQNHFINETDKLWNFSFSSPDFQFKTIDEVLQENYELKEKIECLNDVINDNLTDLANMIIEERRQRKDEDVAIKEMLTQETYERKMNDGTLTDSLANVELELSGNVTAIQKNVTKQINDVYAEIDTEFTEIQDEVSELQNDLIQLHNSPIGSIIAWITKPEDSSSQETVLPDGWVECDGRKIGEPSIWAGSFTPDLNGDKRFLRGGDYKDQRKVEADTFQDHKHIDEGHTHTDQGHSHSYGDYVTSFYDHYCYDQDGNWGPAGSSDKIDNRYDCNYHRTSSGSTSQLSSDKSGVGTVSGTEYRIGSETRPVNMNVIWIMRVW